MASPDGDDLNMVPRKAEPDSPSPTPTPEPETNKDARQYRPLPPARTSYSKPRTETAPRQPVKAVKASVVKAVTVPASAEEEVVVAPKAPRTLMVRPVEAKRLVPAYDEVDEVEANEPVRASNVRTATNRVPTNPLRSR